MINQVLTAINDYDMFKNSTTVTVALSGGADSVALLYCLLELKDRFSLNINAAHLNHHLRGEESDRDEMFVKALCEKLGVPLTVGHADISPLAKNTGKSIELAAREERYSFLTAASSGVIATAHTASDSLETMLFNITRGTGIKGLGGIPPKRDNFIRPLIYCTREQVEQYCNDKNAEFVTDSTNLTDDYTRNKIRHNAVSVLKQINPSVEINATRTAKMLREDEQFLNKTAQVCLDACRQSDGINVKLLLNNDKVIVRRVLKKFYESMFDGTLEYRSVEQLLGVCNGSIKSVTLPLKVTAEIKNEVLILSSGEINRPKLYKSQVRVVKKEKVNNLLLINVFDYDKICGSITVRKRQEGDKIRLQNRGVTKTLKKLFCEKKVSLDDRNSLPVIADQNGVIWVYGFGADERVKVDASTQNIAEVLVEIGD